MAGVQTKRLERSSNNQGEIRDFTDAAIRNQGASIKTLEIQIGQMSKVLQEKGIEGLPGLTEPNPRDHVKSISTTKTDSSEIRRIGCSPYTREAQDVKILEAYDHTLPKKEKYLGSFTLPCIIHNVYFDKALVDLGASDKDDHEGKSPAETLIDIPVSVGKVSILTGFTIIDDEDVTRDAAFGMPFFMKYVSCQMIMKKFAHGDKCERMDE
ncbi:hypothetical protein Tco_1450183 [Tanacetum coccineum]